MKERRCGYELLRKKAQKGSGRIDKSAKSDFQKGKIIYDRKKRDQIRDNYIRDDYAKQEYLASESDIETVSTLTGQGFNFWSKWPEVKCEF